MAEFKLKVKNENSIKDKPRVYFTSHPDDFGRYFERITADLFKTQDCAVYYTENMSEELSEENLSLDIGRMNLFVVPITLKLLAEDNRAMEVEIPFAKEAGIPVLPLMMEDGIIDIYSRPDKFGERQFISPDSHGLGEISYEKKLSDYLSSVLTSGELARRVRAAFDAYIFLSYRKKDRVYANELMKLIHESPKYRDIAIWYDEFLSPGESFRENITKALSDSKLFALLVTPHLLEAGNFVMTEEYPAARKSGKPILPVEMSRTDITELSRGYEEIPTPIKGKEQEALYERLSEMLVGVIDTENDNDPEHLYLIGLAYLNGIDVEVDRERGMEYIISAARQDYYEALDLLYELYRSQGDFTNALEWVKRLYEYNLKTRGEADEQTIICLMNIGYSYDYIGDGEAALTYTREAFDAAKGFLGERHSTTLFAMNNLGVCYLNGGMLDEAKEYLENAYRLRCETLGKEHPDTITALANLAGLYCECGDERAVDVCEVVYVTCRRIFGEEHPDTVISLYNLSEVLFDNGDLERSHELMLKAHGIACKVLGESHPDTLLCMLSLGLSLSTLNKHEEAASLFKRGRELSVRSLGKMHSMSVKFIDYLADEYRIIGNYTEAAKYFEEAYGIYKSLYGEDGEETKACLFWLLECRKMLTD